jgi:RNA polymerase subunit RPABC4/transcription elongation factor Spt4
VQPAAYALPCAFCGTTTDQLRCPTCQRDPRGARRVCAWCQRNTPTGEKPCMHCGVVAQSDLGWKVPVIVVMFLLAFAIAVAVHR